MARYKPNLQADVDAPAEYFYAMLDDADRSVQYSRAIAAVIRDFVNEQGRAPVVLDLGVGTGLLTALSVKHGAARVVGVDKVKHCIDATEANLRRLGVECERATPTAVEGGTAEATAAAPASVTLVHIVEASSMALVPQFDVLVSEILGTLVTGESMKPFVQAATLRSQASGLLRPEGLHAVPDHRGPRPAADAAARPADRA